MICNYDVKTKSPSPSLLHPSETTPLQSEVSITPPLKKKTQTTPQPKARDKKSFAASQRNGSGTKPTVGASGELSSGLSYAASPRCVFKTSSFPPSGTSCSTSGRSAPPHTQRSPVFGATPLLRDRGAMQEGRRHFPRYLVWGKCAPATCRREALPRVLLSSWFRTGSSSAVGAAVPSRQPPRPETL